MRRIRIDDTKRGCASMACRVVSESPQRVRGWHGSAAHKGNAVNRRGCYALSGLHSHATRYAGRCPGLSCCGPLGQDCFSSRRCHKRRRFFGTGALRTPVKSRCHTHLAMKPGFQPSLRDLGASEPPRPGAPGKCGATLVATLRDAGSETGSLNPRFYLTWFMVGLFLLGAGCTRGIEQKAFDSTPITTTKTEGPVTLTLSATPAEPAALSPMKIRVLAEAPPGVALMPQDYALTLRSGVCRFDCRIIRATEPNTPRLEGDRLRWSQDIEIEFLLAGEYELPPAGLSFTDTRETDSAQGSDAGAVKPESKEVRTEALNTKVTAPSDGELSPDQLAAIKTLDPIELPTRWNRWWWLAPLLILAGSAVLALIVYLLAQVIPPLQHLLNWMRRRWTRMVTPPPVPPIAAHEWANRQFTLLLADNLIASGRIREFCFRLSDIVRGYIERRFDVCAPEMTTEEFFAATAHDPRFGQRNTMELQRFLSACDLVKYAGFRPDPEDADGLIRAAMDFVERTRATVATENESQQLELTEAAA